MHTATPGTTGHGGTRRDGSDGAIPQILGGSPTGPTFHQFNHYPGGTPELEIQKYTHHYNFLQFKDNKIHRTSRACFQTGTRAE